MVFHKIEGKISAISRTETGSEEPIPGKRRPDAVIIDRRGDIVAAVLQSIGSASHAPQIMDHAFC